MFKHTIVSLLILSSYNASGMESMRRSQSSSPQSLEKNIDIANIEQTLQKLGNYSANEKISFKKCIELLRAASEYLQKIQLDDARKLNLFENLDQASSLAALATLPNIKALLEQKNVRVMPVMCCYYGYPPSWNGSVDAIECSKKHTDYNPNSNYDHYP